MTLASILGKPIEHDRRTVWQATTPTADLSAIWRPKCLTFTFYRNRERVILDCAAKKGERPDLVLDLVEPAIRAAFGGEL